VNTMATLISKITVKALSIMLFASIFLGMSGAVLIAAPGSQPAIAAPSVVGPSLTIASNIPADPNSTVFVPVTFQSNGNSVASMVYSIDFDQTYLSINPTEAFSITMNLPSGFSGSCLYHPLELNGEVDCTIFSFPVKSLPDGVITTILFHTANPASGVNAFVNFAEDPPVSFGGIDGFSIAGSAVNGSVQIGGGCTSCGTPSKAYLPIVLNSSSIQPPQPGCTNYILNPDFESRSWWFFPATQATARYSDKQNHTPGGSWSALTGIYYLDWDWSWYSYSSVWTQPIYIPYNVTTVTLTYWENSFSPGPYKGTLAPEGTLPQVPAEGTKWGEKPLLGGNDLQYVVVLDPWGNIVRQLQWQQSDAEIWVMHQFNLKGFAGFYPSFHLAFGTYNDGFGAPSSMFVDDVDLEVCTP